MVIEKKTVGISSLIALGLIISSLLIPGFFDTPKYYCEAESSILECPGELSGGAATRCYLNEEKNSWDYCKSGWVEISDDRPIQEEPEEVQVEEIEIKVKDSVTGIWGNSYKVTKDGIVELGN